MLMHTYLATSQSTRSCMLSDSMAEVLNEVTKTLRYLPEELYTILLFVQVKTLNPNWEVLSIFVTNETP